ncbi:MAG: DUF4845 domain-containing protein [Panacagrimonas sp.]
MNRSIERQRGMGWLSLLFVFGAIAFVVLVGIKVGPLYLNNMTVKGVVEGVASDPAMANADASQIRDALGRRWDIDYIDQIAAKDIKIKRTTRGRVLAYDYEARVELFYNIDVVVHFEGEATMPASQNPEL